MDTNDGYEESVVDVISSLSFANIVYETSKKIITTKEAEFVSNKIVLSDDNREELICSTDGGCANANIMFKNNSICNLMCNNLVSCAGATVSIINCDNTEIICNGSNSCDGLNVAVVKTSSNYDKMEIQCGTLYQNIITRTGTR